jgi:hypothetical protein
MEPSDDQLEKRLYKFGYILEMKMKRKEFLYSQLPTGTYHKLLVICKTKNL